MHPRPLRYEVNAESLLCSLVSLVRFLDASVKLLGPTYAADWPAECIATPSCCTQSVMIACDPSAEV